MINKKYRFPLLSILLVIVLVSINLVFRHVKIGSATSEDVTEYDLIFGTNADVGVGRVIIDRIPKVNNAAQVTLISPAGDSSFSTRVHHKELADMARKIKDYFEKIKAD